MLLTFRYITHEFNQLIAYLSIFALFCDICHGIGYLNALYLAWPRRPLNTSDVIVITGGSSGLGLAITAILSTKNYTVFNLDVSAPPISLPNVTFISCDVSHLTNVEKAHKEIKEVYDKNITVLINNAGTVTDRTILELPEEKIRQLVDIDLLSHFWTIKTFLPGMLALRRGYIVSVSSVLGYIGPARLSAYSAAKAGVNMLHDSLTHENDTRILKTLLVTVGQMDTPMFKYVPTPSNFLAPVLPRANVAQTIVDALERGDCGELSLPVYAKLIHWTRIIPRSVTEIVRKVYEMDKSMEKFSKSK